MILRAMTLAELDTALDWAAAAGWNPGLEDAAAFHATDPGGFFVAEVAGAPVAAISVVNHSDRFAFLGLYLCRPEFRGRGIGLALWRHALDHAGDRTVGLDGVPAQQDNYRRSGFVPAGRTSRFAGVLPAAPGAARPATPADLPALIAQEAAASGVDKARFLSLWLTDTATRQTLVAPDGAGFVTLRRCRTGVKLGPLVAPDLGAAARLLGAAGALADGAPAMIDLPLACADLADHCRALGLSESFATARMYRGTPPPPVRGALAVATLELG
jgi:GNAT superfamily N-acetyltransferase